MNRMERLYRRVATRGPNSILEWTLFGLLVPFGFCLALVGMLRAVCYRWRLLPQEKMTVPVISVGNLAVGGTGKTPMVDFIVRFLLANNCRVAVVSRGYGGKRHSGIKVVCAGEGPLLKPDDCGDEPYLLALRNPAAFVLVTPRRRDAIRLAVKEFGAEVIVLDDGFQHLAVGRDLDIVLLDAERPFGNGYLLPAGLLREPKSALRRGDLFILTRCPKDMALSVPVPGPVLRCRHRLAERAHALDGQSLDLNSLTRLRGVAFAGIAEPESFFSMLRDMGLTLVAEISFADHCSYGCREINRLCSASRGADYLITTEKDGVKFAGIELPIPCYQVPVTLEFHERGVLEDFLRPYLSKRDKTMTLSPELMDILVCPHCKRSLVSCMETERLLCEHCGLAYPIRDDIPLLLVDEAIKLV